jgi:molecular chaperone GrpE
MLPRQTAMIEDDPSAKRSAPIDVEALGARVAQLEAEVAAAREEARQSHERWVRERADLENQKKRAARERQDAERFGNETLVKDLLPILDNLERAIRAADGGGDGKRLVEGVQLVLKAFVDLLQRHGVERVSAAGEPFDPTRHEAVAHVESESHAPNHVIDEHQAGYRLHDRLLRPALVTVSKGSGRDPSKLASEEGGD